MSHLSGLTNLRAMVKRPDEMQDSGHRPQHSRGADGPLGQGTSEAGHGLQRSLKNGHDVAGCESRTVGGWYLVECIVILSFARVMVYIDSASAKRGDTRVKPPLLPR